MKKKILWVSLCAPYDGVAHGGGKTHNFYLKQVHTSGKFNVHLVTFCDMDEFDKAENDLTKYGIMHTLIPWTHEVNVKNIKRKVQLIDAEKNPFNRYGGGTNLYYWDQMKQSFDRLKFSPDVVILQWTEIVLYADKIKKYFSKSKIVAIEEDVKFLANQRRIGLAKSKLESWIAKNKYRQLKNVELRVLQQVDAIITYSEKDKKLLTDENIQNVNIVSPYFDDFSNCEYQGDIKDIVFYGAMSRQDNYDSAIWFIENVFNKLENKNLRFVIIGSKPAEKLKAYANERIVITGFVESVMPYFEHSLCLVASLISGAGIKIKILEALSAGIPVVTNHIGIEGILAKAGEDYIHCESAEEYVEAITKLLDDQSYREFLGKSAKALIRANYNREREIERFVNILDGV